mgnify:CR=1 FL=1
MSMQIINKISYCRELLSINLKIFICIHILNIKEEPFKWNLTLSILTQYILIVSL